MEGKIKKLDWRSIVTKEAAESGWIHMIGSFQFITVKQLVNRNSLNDYHVTNCPPKDISGVDGISTFFYMDCDQKTYRFKSLESAQEFAQQHFENWVKETFFEKI